MNIQPRITIRVSKGSLAFAMADSRTEAKVAFEPYTAKSGVSMAANLRDAFKTANLLQVPTHRALVLIDAPTLLIPIEEFQEANAETLYTHCYPTTECAFHFSTKISMTWCINKCEMVILIIKRRNLRKDSNASFSFLCIIVKECIFMINTPLMFYCPCSIE